MFVFTVLMILITLLNIIVHYLRQHQEVEQEYGQTNTSPSSPGLQCRRFSIAEIKSATQNFDEGLVIGKGGFGQVYKGIIDNGESIVAIKRLGFRSNQGAPEFWTEVEMLSKFRHSHLVSLIGYCNDKPEMIIVYEYMPSGTLADNFHKFGRTNRPLSWEQRLKVCIGAARGLDYLHTGMSIQTRVIHRDVKSSNILLDANRESKISDFGLSKISPTEQPFSHVSTHVKGTFGYLDPEYLLTHRLTRKSDVYAFGVIMFEALCGRQALDVRLDEEQWALAKWAKHCIKEGRLLEIVDPHLRGSILSNCLEAFAQIAEQCLHKSSRKRPTMAKVVTRLEYALALQETTNISLMDAEIIINGGDYDNQEGSVSSTEAEARNAGGRNFSAEPEAFDTGNVGHSEEHATSLSQFHIQPAKKMTFVKKLQLLFTSKALVITDDEYSDLRLGQLKRFSLRELKVATNNFNDNNFLGRGRFGKVYRGCLADGSLVAIMRLVVKHTQNGELQFQTEVKIIDRAIHRNLLQLQGFGTTSTERLLVYPYMVNGSVASHLRDQLEWQSVLDWSTRKKIALGSARGLAYLHEDCIPCILHRDIQAESIFLNKHFEAVIGNFGLVRLMNNSDTLVPTSIIRYAAPEYITTARCSRMTDVYAFGVLLLELITGQRAIDPAQRANADDVIMFDWVKKLVMERKLETLVGMGPQVNYVVEEVERLMQVVLLCTQYSPMKRPRMSEVVRILEGDGLTSRWEEWQKEEIFHSTSYADSFKDIGSEELSSPR